MMRTLDAVARFRTAEYHGHMLPRLSSIIAGFLFFPALVESAAIVQKVAGIPLGFEQNRGQAPAPARYLVR
ncbi:MAG: hypothetical protein LLG20_04620, partial [Acidobacteriales bacterium]|nr:hypothetical protein [Terriglobales bacterium]